MEPLLHNGIRVIWLLAQVSLGRNPVVLLCFYLKLLLLSFSLPIIDQLGGTCLETVELLFNLHHKVRILDDLVFFLIFDWYFELVKDFFSLRVGFRLQGSQLH